VPSRKFFARTALACFTRAQMVEAKTVPAAHDFGFRPGEISDGGTNPFPKNLVPLFPGCS
jgi:hypothetical protein